MTVSYLLSVRINTHCSDLKAVIVSYVQYVAFGPVHLCIKIHVAKLTRPHVNKASRHGGQAIMNKLHSTVRVKGAKGKDTCSRIAGMEREQRWGSVGESVPPLAEQGGALESQKTPQSVEPKEGRRCPRTTACRGQAPLVGKGGHAVVIRLQDNWIVAHSRDWQEYHCSASTVHSNLVLMPPNCM